MTLCAWCGRLLAHYGARCPHCIRRERTALGTALVAIVALIGLTLLCGCAGWQTTTTKTVLSVEEGAVHAREFVKGQCTPAVTDKCIEKRDAECKPLQLCEVATKAIHSLETAVLVAKLAIKAGKEGTAIAAVAAAVAAIGPVLRAVDVWR